jgi:hypothetical protein
MIYPLAVPIGIALSILSIRFRLRHAVPLVAGYAFQRDGAERQMIKVSCTSCQKINVRK